MSSEHQQPSPSQRLRADYLSGADRLRRFYRHPLPEADWWSLRRYRAAFQAPRQAVVDSLRARYAELGLALFPAQQVNLRRLAERGSYTITTGHQPVLGGGPLYTWYKALTTLKLAEREDALPVFWVAGEDHDADELNRLYLGYRPPLQYPGQLAGPVGRVRLEQNHLQAIALPAPVRDCYQAGQSWSGAFIQLLHRLLGPYGLLILDADRPELKALFRPGLTRELLEQPSQRLVNGAGQALAAQGYPQQLEVGPYSLFYLAERQRLRLEPAPNGWRAGSLRQWTEAELLAELDAHPERFSPNAALRPVYQEVLLPNLAYVGGWGELAYWLQLRGLFDHLSTPFPLLVPRAGGLLLRPEQAEALQALGLHTPGGLDLLLSDWGTLRAHFLEQLADEQTDLQDGFKLLEAAFDQLETQTAQASATLPHTVAAWRHKTQRWQARLHHKWQNARLERTGYPRARSLRQHIQPPGYVQERSLSLWAFAHSWDEAAELLHQLYAQLALDTYTRQDWTLQGVGAGITAG